MKRRLPSSLETTWQVVRCSFQLVVKVPLTTWCHVVRAKAVGSALGVKWLCKNIRSMLGFAHCFLADLAAFTFLSFRVANLTATLVNLSAFRLFFFFLSLSFILLVDLKGSVLDDVIKCIIICMMLDETMLVRLDYFVNVCLCKVLRACRTFTCCRSTSV